MKSLKSMLVIVLCPMLLLQGCYSYSTFTQGSPETIPPPDNTIAVSTADGNDYEIEPYHFVAVREPSSFIFGSGERAGKGSTEFHRFTGFAHPLATSRYTALTPTRWGSTEKDPCINAVCDDGSTVRILEHDCVFVDSATGPGLWCKGLKNGDPFSGRIPFDQIRSVEVKKLSALKTTALAVAGFGTVVAIVVIATFHIDFDMGSSGTHY